MAIERSLKIDPDGQLGHTINDLPPRSDCASEIPENIAIDEAKAVPRLRGYQMMNRLGAGGMGVVWRALHTATRRQVAVKFLNLVRSGSEIAMRRFDREVEITSLLAHPNIATVYDSGIDQGVYFYAMELVDGLPLDLFIQQRCLNQREILSLMMVISRAVHHAHQRGVIHRDLKPSNILVDSEGSPHILDFGLGKLLDNPLDSTISTDGQWVGTPIFMSPEQATGQPDQVDARSDVYSLGIILYYLLLGQYPHDPAGGNLSVLRRLAEEEIVRPRKVQPSLNRELETLLFKALAKSRDDRYSSAEAFALDIENYLNGDPLLSRPPTAVYYLQKKVRKHRLAIGIAVVLCSVAVYGSIRLGGQLNRSVSRDKLKSAVMPERDLASADRLVALADTLGNQGQWAQAERRYWEAQQLRANSQVVPTAAALGLLQVHLHSPHPLTHAPLPSVVDGSLGRFDQSIGFDGHTIRWADQNGAVFDTDLVAGSNKQTIAAKFSDTPVLSAAIFPQGNELVRLVVDRLTNPTSPTVSVERLALQGGGDSHSWLLDGIPAIATASPDARSVAIVVDLGNKLAPTSRLHVLNLGTGSSTELPSLGHISAMEFFPDSRYLATTGDGGLVTKWDLDSSKAVGILNTALEKSNGEWPRTVSRMKFSPDGNELLVADNRGGISYISLPGSFPIRALTTEDRVVTALAISGDQRFGLSGDAAGALRVWELSTGKLVYSVSAEQSISDACFSADQESILCKDRDGVLTVWPFQIDPGSSSFHHRSPVNCMALSFDGRLAAAGLSNKQVDLIDLPTGHLLRSFGLDFPAQALKFATNGKTIDVAASNGEISRVEVFGDGRPVLVCPPKIAMADLDNNPPDESDLPGIAILSPQDDIAIRLTHRGAVLLNIGRQEQIKILDHEFDRIGCFSSDGKAAAVVHLGARQTIGLFELDRSDSKEIPIKRTSVPTALALSADHSTTFVGTSDGQIEAYSSSGDQQFTAVGPHAAIECLALSPDGQTLLSGGAKGSLLLWDVKDGRLIRTVEENLSPITAVGFSGDGARIGSSGQMKESTLFWDLSLPTQLKELDNRANSARSVLLKDANNSIAINLLLEWYSACGVSSWAKQLLDRHPGSSVTSLAAARCLWATGDGPEAAKMFEELIQRGDSGESKEYLEACAHAAKARPQ